ncbi:MAG: S9 family peptidase [Algicola sp.]|nr:S9 family peptidase [Algicola sp.]
MTRILSVWTVLLAIQLTQFSSTLAAESLSVERLHSSPSLSGKSPRRVSFSPDGTRVTYLQGKVDDHRRYDLWEYHIKDKTKRMLVDSARLFAGKEVLSDEEKARRERMRVSGSGIISYKWSDDGKALLFPINGDLYYYELKSQKNRKLTNTPEFETDVRFSPKGNFVSFIREQNLFVLNVSSGKETQLTTDGGGLIKNGMAEFVAQEEIGRMTGYWWADDESKIAFTRTDESPVQEIIRNEIYADEVKLFEQRYPYAGTSNAKIELGVVRLSNKKVDWLDLGKETDFYLARAQWLPDNKTLSYQWQNRSQQKLELRFYDSKRKTTEVALTETNKTWLNLHYSLYFLEDSPHFVWASERDGFMHLYLYKNNGKLVRQLTKGDWIVDGLKGVDEKKGLAYFTGRADTPLESHLYSVKLFKSSKIKRLTDAGSYHYPVLADDNRTFIDYQSSSTKPSSVALRDISGQFITWLERNEVNASHPLHPYIGDFVNPEFGTIKAEDGQDLYYKIHKPKDMGGNKRYPVIVKVYGGPGAQTVKNNWSNPYFTQYLVQQGFVVFQLDNRGSTNRGKRFEDPIYKLMGETEVTDQVSGVKFLRTLDFVDPQRIGIYGHSYGGYMVLMAMFKAGDYFQAGVVGAPVTDWALYDTHYTERYLGNPKSNAKGYEASSVFGYSKNLKGPMLIYHGMADDNVLFTNSTKLFKQLQDQGLPFEMMTYPGSKHSMRGKKVGVHLDNTITQFFDRNLKRL